MSEFGQSSRQEKRVREDADLVANPNARSKRLPMNRDRSLVQASKLTKKEMITQPIPVRLQSARYVLVISYVPFALDVQQHPK